MKHLIVCADGTWNFVEREAGGAFTSTNVAKLAAFLSPTAKLEAGYVDQRLRYLEGVGTAEEDQVSGGAFGWGLSANIRAAYQFLAENYEPGDKIFLFGFSRGAFTVRSLGGLIEHAGIPKDSSDRGVDAAMSLYRERNIMSGPEGVRASIFRLENSHHAEIEMIGVWDTVGALGSPMIRHQVANTLGWNWKFHDTRLGSMVKHAYHALAIHERRSKFRPTLWTSIPDDPERSVEQVWFSGVHSDVGGGYLETHLSNVCLIWMMEKAAEHGLAFRNGWKAAIENDPQGKVFSVHNSFKGMGCLPDLLKRRFKGTPRDFRENEWGSPQEKIHSSVRTHFESDADKESWPARFREIPRDSAVDRLRRRLRLSRSL